MNKSYQINHTPTPDGAATELETFEMTLREAAASWFAKQGAPVLTGQGHCLSEPFLWHHNIICPEVVDLIHRTERA